MVRTSPGIKCPECHACKQSGHLIGAPICPGPSKKTKTGTGKNMVKVKKVNSTTKEDTDQEESDVDTIGRIKRIRVGAVAASPALMCGGGGNQAREMLQTNLDPVDSG